MKKSHTCPYLEILFSKFYLTIALLLTSFFAEPLKADQNNTSFIVAGGNLNSPFYTLTFEANGSAVDFESYPLRKGNTYAFKPGNISASHPFNIGASHNVSSPHVTGGPLDQNSANNGQSMTVSIPNDFQGTLAYFCTVHASMNRTFIILEPNPVDTNGTNFLPVYDLNSTHLHALTSAQGVVVEGNYSIVEEMNATNNPEIRIRPMFFSNGDWQIAGQNQFYNANQNIQSMQDVDAYLQSQNLYPVNGPQGHPIYDLNTTQVTYLTNDAVNQAGHYAVVDVNQSHADLEPVQQDGNGSWIVTPADDYVNLVPSRFSDINATKAWFDANASAPVAYLPFDNNHSQLGDHNQTNPGSGPNDHNTSGHLAVFDLNSSHLYQLTGSESAPEGNYSIVEQDDGQGGTYLTALPMQFSNGQWQEDPQGIPYPLNSQAFPVMQDVDTFLQSQNLYPINGPQGHPIYDLNTTQVTNLTNGAANQAGHYAVVDVNESFVDLEPVQQDGNGSWIVTPADDYVNLVPSRFSDINATKAWFDANASAPVAFLPFDNNHSQPGDHNQSNPGSSPNDHNTSGYLAVFDFNSSHLFQLTGSESAPEGNYSIVEEDDGQGGTYLTALPMQFNNDQWQEDPQGIPYPLDSQTFPVMQDVDVYLLSQNLYPVNEPQGHPIYDLNTSQVTNLTNGAANQAGHYAVVDVNESFVDLEPVQQDGNGSWIVTPADDYVNLVPSRFSDINATKAWFDANASAPVAFLPFDNNHSQPGDHNQSNPGSNPNDQNVNANLNDSNFQDAIDMWFTDEANATNTYGHIKDWNVSAVTDMSSAFKDRASFNVDISNWDVSSVTNMGSMFRNAYTFDQPIGEWNVSAVTNMGSMFRTASNFNQPIGDWDTGNVTNMAMMFSGAALFNQPIGSWDTSQVANMKEMFRTASNFNQPIGIWDVSSVTNMLSMFQIALDFNQPLHTWDTSNVINMESMFSGASDFNQPLNDWNVSSVTKMRSMFKTTNTFNNSLGDWDVSNVTTFVDMFSDANGLSEINKGEIHSNFKSNTSWTIDWSAHVQSSSLTDSNLHAVFDFNSSHLFQLTGSESAPEGNYSIVEEDDGQGGTYLTALPMQFNNDQWQEDPQGIPYPLNSQAFPVMQDVDTFLQSQNLYPINGPQGHPIYDLNTSQVTNLTNGAANQAGHYAVVDVNESFVDLEPVQQDGNGSWIVTPADDYVNLVPSRFSDINATKAWFDANASAPVAYLPFDNNHSQPSDHNQTNPGSGPNDHNTSGHLAVFDLNSSHLYQLTGSESAPEGNYSIVEQDDGQGGTYLTALPMQFSNGQWQEDPQGIPYPLNSQAFPVMQDVDTFLQSQNLYPINGPQGHPIYDLNTTQVTNLTNGAANLAGHYAVVDVNQSHADLEPVQQDGNGSWIVTPADDYVNLVPSRFSDINATKAWFDANASAPVAYLPFDNNHSQPGDHNQSNPGSAGDHNDTQGLPVFALDVTQAETLVDGFASAGSYAVEIFMDYDTGIEQRLLVSAVQLAGIWEREFDALENPVALPISSAQFPTPDSIYQYIDQQNLQPIGYIFENHDHNGTDPGGDPWDQNGTNPGSAGDHNDTQGLPVFALDVTQAETLVDGFASAGSYAVEIFMDYDTGIEQRLLVSAVQLAGIWEREFDALENPVALPISSAQFPTPDSIYQYIDQQNLQPIGYIENHDHNGTDPGGDPWDQNGTNPGSAGDHNDTQGLPVFALDVTQAETLVDGFASAGSYAVEIFMDYDTGIEQRLLVSAVQSAGVWEREFDALENPVALPISSAQFPTPDSIYQYIDQQNLQPIGYIENHDHNGTDPGGDPWDQNGTNPGSTGDHNDTQGLPVFALDVTQAETLVDGFASAGSYAVEIFMDYDTGIEQRLLVSAVQSAGVWEREFDALGNPIAFPISSAHFPNTDYIYQYIDQQNLEPIGFLMEDPDDHEDDGPFDFTIIGEVDLTNPQNLFELATSHDSIWFQKWATPENLDNTYWALSIESNNSNISSLVVDMNGSIYSGNFHSYWRDAFGIIADYENEESDWKEYRYDPSETSIQKLYDDAPELYGQDRPLPPIVKTVGNPIFRNNFIQVSAYIESLGNNPDLIFGFQVSDSIFFDQAEEIIVQGNFAEGDLLETSFDFSYLEADRLYYRAFARNSLFESFGTKKRARMPLIETIPPTLFPDAERLEDGWKENWLGVFHEYSNGWMYHLDLGWCFASPDNLGNVWLWINDHGWVWTNESTWPHLFRNQTSSWLYLLIRQSGPAVFFDQMHGSFMHLNK